MDGVDILGFVVAGFVFVLFLVLSVILFKGKGAFLIAGYNTMSPQEQAKYDICALSRLAGILLFIVDMLVLAMIVGAALDLAWLSVSSAILGIAVCIVGILYANRSKRFKR